MATRRGLVKKTPLEDYSRPRAGGIIGINLDEGDGLIDVALTQPGDEVLLCTRRGMAIRFDEADARAMGRNTRGVKGIALQDDDAVVGMVVADPAGYLLTVCENGYGKRTPFGANTHGVEPAEADGEEADGEPDGQRRSGEPAAKPPATDDAEAGEEAAATGSACATASSGAAARASATSAPASATARWSACRRCARPTTSCSSRRAAW